VVPARGLRLGGFAVAILGRVHQCEAQVEGA